MCKITQSVLLQTLYLSQLLSVVVFSKQFSGPQILRIATFFLAPQQLSLVIVGDGMMTVSHLLTFVTLSLCRGDLCQTGVLNGGGGVAGGV